MSTEGVIEIRASPLGGNGTFARKTHNAGDVLLALERPLITALDEKRMKDTCSWCFSWTELPILSGAGVNQTAQVHWCTGCRRTRYCSKRCQSQAWKNIHKRECKEMRGQPHTVPSTVLAIIQIMDGLSVGDKKFDAILELEAHRDDYENAAGSRWEAMNLMVHTAMMFMQEKGVNVQRESAKMALCVLMSNSFSLTTSTCDPLGLVLDPQVARINHSCVPNAVIVFDGPRLAVRALRRIAEGNEVLVSYVDSTAPFGIRQAELKDRYFFRCNCQKCQLSKKAPQDAVLDPGPGFEQRISVIDDMLPQVRQDAAWPRHVLGDSIHEQRLSALQFYGYSHLDSPGTNSARDPVQLRKVIHIIQNTGVWPLSRGPLPALYQQYAVACLSAKRNNEALIAMLRLHVMIDPTLYPEPHHPVRIVHSWSLATLAKAVGSNPDSAFCNVLRAQGVDLSMLFLALLFEIVEQVSKSHGAKSLFGETVGGALQAMMEPGGELDVQFSQMGIKRDQWPKLVEDQIKELWPKVTTFVNDERIAQEINEALAES